MENSPSNRKRSSVRRANVTACQRCKSRKQRCDQNIPACSSCTRAGVPCVSVDIDGQSAPRSYIKSLEDRVAELELALHSQGIDTESVAGRRVSQDALESTPEAPHSSDLNLLGLLVPKPVDLQHPEDSGYHALLDSITVPETIKFPPKPTAIQLTATYFEHSNFFSPVLDEESFHSTIAALYQEQLTPEQGTSIQKFQLCMVLAIAIRLLNRTDSSVPTVASDSFFASAIGILTERPQATWKGDLQHLQNLLLVVQYTIFASNLSAAWHFIGLATRLAIDLDLLNETRLSVTNSAHESDAEVNHRRRVFWSTYILETNLCVILNRPRSIPDEAIFTPLPSTSGPESSSPLANHCVLFRQLEYEIFHTLNYKPPANGNFFDYKAWKMGMKNRLMDWHANVPPVDATSKLAPQNFFDGALYMTLVSLFSPSRHFPHLSEEELRDLAQCASTSIELYREGFKEVEGIFTLLVFFVFILLLPRSPIHTKPIHGRFDLFTSREREIMHDRIYQEDISKTEAHAKITFRGVIAALTDYRIWIHTILNVVSLAPKGGLQLYGPTIIRSLGFSKINSNLLNSVSSFLVVFLSFTIAWASDKTKQRGLWCMVAFLWSITFGGALFGSTYKDKWTKYALFTLLSSGNALSQGLNDAWLSINTRSAEKRSIGLALVVIGSNAGGLAGKQLFRESDAPKYTKGFLAIVLLYAAALPITAVIMGVYWRQNKKLERELVENEGDVDEQVGRSQRFQL